MSNNKDHVLKRCRSLGIEPGFLGYNKKSTEKSLNMDYNYVKNKKQNSYMEYKKDNLDIISKWLLLKKV